MGLCYSEELSEVRISGATSASDVSYVGIVWCSVFMVHQKRELGQLADGISKKEMVMVNAELHARGLCELSPERCVADDTAGLSELMTLLRGLAVVEASNGLQRLLPPPS